MESNYATHLWEVYTQDLYPFKSHQISESKICPRNGLTYEHLYVIKNNNTGLYKIGITKNIRQRFAQLRTQSGCDLNLTFNILFEQGYDEITSIAEKYLHEYFKDKRVKGEWFNLNPRDLVKIRIWGRNTLEINNIN
jgi:predicted GIY-YIG superfamily endonuclease